MKLKIVKLYEGNEGKNGKVEGRIKTFIFSDDYLQFFIRRISVMSDYRCDLTYKDSFKTKQQVNREGHFSFDRVVEDVEIEVSGLHTKESFDGIDIGIIPIRNL